MKEALHDIQNPSWDPEMQEEGNRDGEKENTTDLIM